nr:hypothetical protein [Nitrosomonas nitrosa]
MSENELKNKEDEAVLAETEEGFSPAEQSEYDKLAQNDTPGDDGGLYNPGKKIAKKGGRFSRRSKVAIGGGLSAILVSLLIGFFMFMTVYRVEHVRNLLWDYRFARFHGQVAKRIKSNLMLSETYTNPSTSPERKLRFEKTSLYEKLRGYSPEKAFKELGSAGLDIEVRRGGKLGLGENRITGFTDTVVDPETGRSVRERIYVEGSRNIPDGAKTVNSLEFANRLSTASTNALESAGHSRYFQKQTRKLLKTKVRINFGDRYAAFKEKINKLSSDGTTTTPEEEARALREVDAETARGNQSIDTSVIDEKETQEDLLDDLTEPDSGSLNDTPTRTEAAEARRAKIRESRTYKKLQGGVSGYAQVSTGVMIATFGCILYDLSSSVDDALTQRIEAPMRLSGSVFGEAEQLKSGEGVDIRQVKERNKTLEGVEESGAFKAIDGETNIPQENKLQVDDLPFKFFGLDLSTVSTFNSGVKTTLETALASTTGPLFPVLKVLGKDDDVVRKGCSYILNPGVQAGIAVVDVAALFASLGSTGAAEGAVRAGIEGLKATIQIGGSVGLGKVVFEYVVPKVLFSLAGANGILHSGDAQNGNKLDLGATLLASQTTKMAGGTKISAAQARRDNFIAYNQAREDYYKNEGLLAFVSPSSPYSIPGTLSMKLSGDPFKIPGQLLANVISVGANIFNGRLFASLFSGKANAASEVFETYGVPQYGIPDSMIDVDPLDNALAVDGFEGQLDGLLEEYHQCFDTSLAEESLKGLFGSSDNFDYSKCDNSTAQQLGLYLVDNCAVSFISETTNTNTCSLLSGAGDLTAN